jgi:predicted PurR-regulated permease PerM
MERNKNQYQRTVPFILFIIALILLFVLIKPMISIIFGGILLSYISFPLYQRISKKIPSKSFSIIFSLFIVFVLIIIPFAFLIFEIANQGYSFHNSLSENIEKGALFGFSCDSAESKICLIINQAEKFSLEQLSKVGLDTKLQGFLEVLKDKIASFIFKIPLIIAEIFLMFLLAYFILVDWKNLRDKVMDLIPITPDIKSKLIENFKNITHTVIYAQLFVAFVQGLSGAIAFYLLGVPFPVVLGLIMAFCALIPAIGTAIVWLPASFYLILMGHFSNSPWILVKGIILMFYGFLIISTIDNFLLAKIVHKKAKVNQILIIIGVIGGFSLLGFIGIFVGPILLPLLITYFQTFKERFN